MKRHSKSTSVLITKLTCTENSAMGAQNLGACMVSVFIQNLFIKPVYCTSNWSGRLNFAYMYAPLSLIHYLEFCAGYCGKGWMMQSGLSTPSCPKFMPLQRSRVPSCGIAFLTSSTAWRLFTSCPPLPLCSKLTQKILKTDPLKWCDSLRLFQDHLPRDRQPFQ